MADQNAAVAYFVQRGLIDKARVGMFGWSYGGTALFEVFALFAVLLLM